ncbi:MAG: response regulator [Xenococcaceae cyanobacterium MO_207.B15]|nr:response regulator [Xenococcaceae cyanobacterium MO_207.B15]
MLKTEQQIEYRNIDLKELFGQLQELKNGAFTGSLKLKLDENSSFQFLFRLGHLSIPSSSNSTEKWCRNLKLFCPKLNDSHFQSLVLEKDLRQQYNILVKLLGQGLIERQQLADGIASVNREVLFDVIQLCQIGNHQLSYRIITDDPNSKIISILPVVEITSILKQALQEWKKWQNEGLASYSPNLFPIIKKPELLQKQSLSKPQSLIISLINGIESLRNLAITSNLEIATVTKYLLPLVKLGVIEFSPVPIPRKSDISHIGNNSSISTSPEKKFLIACVDDSPVACQALEKVICSQGYSFVGIQDGLKALALFLKNKPNLIFLDLMMPIINGYELCAQIRKTPSLKNVPVVILTGRDGLVDRMRAKMVGSTDFLSKPVGEKDLLNVIDKYVINT